MRKRDPLIFLLVPALLYVALLWFVPVFSIFFMSLTEGDSSITGNPKFIGFQNYIVVFSSYLGTLRNTLMFPFIAALLDLALGYPLEKSNKGFFNLSVLWRHLRVLWFMEPLPPRRYFRSNIRLAWGFLQSFPLYTFCGNSWLFNIYAPIYGALCFI